MHEGETDVYKNPIYEKPYSCNCVKKKKVCILKLVGEVDTNGSQL